LDRPRVLLADDHAIVVDGLSSLLKDQFELVGTVADGQALVDAVRRLHPDVIVTDIAMPGMSGLEALRRLSADGLKSKFIFLTMHSDPQLAAEAFRAGASGYVLKHSAGEELVTAINEVLQGRAYLTPLLTRDVLVNLGDALARPKAKLTSRQREVLRLLMEGRRMKEIAAELHLSRRTVESHKYDMMHALGVRTTAELIQYVIRNELADS
jgi:DNA-binding NarL/FixJ family response regulator